MVHLRWTNVFVVVCVSNLVISEPLSNGFQWTNIFKHSNIGLSSSHSSRPVNVKNRLHGQRKLKPNVVSILQTSPEFNAPPLPLKTTQSELEKLTKHDEKQLSELTNDQLTLAQNPPLNPSLVFNSQPSDVSRDLSTNQYQSQNDQYQLIFNHYQPNYSPYETNVFVPPSAPTENGEALTAGQQLISSKEQPNIQQTKIFNDYTTFGQLNPFNSIQKTNLFQPADYYHPTHHSNLANYHPSEQKSFVQNQPLNIFSNQLNLGLVQNTETLKGQDFSNAFRQNQHSVGANGGYQSEPLNDSPYQTLHPNQEQYKYQPSFSQNQPLNIFSNQLNVRFGQNPESFKVQEFSYAPNQGKNGKISTANSQFVPSTDFPYQPLQVNQEQFKFQPPLAQNQPQNAVYNQLNFGLVQKPESFKVDDYSNIPTHDQNGKTSNADSQSVSSTDSPYQPLKPNQEQLQYQPYAFNLENPGVINYQLSVNDQATFQSDQKNTEVQGSAGNAQIKSLNYQQNLNFPTESPTRSLNKDQVVSIQYQLTATPTNQNFKFVETTSNQKAFPTVQLSSNTQQYNQFPFKLSQDQFGALQFLPVEYLHKSLSQNTPESPVPNQSESFKDQATSNQPQPFEFSNFPAFSSSKPYKLSQDVSGDLQYLPVEYLLDHSSTKQIQPTEVSNLSVQKSKDSVISIQTPPEAKDQLLTIPYEQLRQFQKFTKTTPEQPTEAPQPQLKTTESNQFDLIRDQSQSNLPSIAELPQGSTATLSFNQGAIQYGGLTPEYTGTILFTPTQTPTNNTDYISSAGSIQYNPDDFSTTGGQYNQGNYFDYSSNPFYYGPNDKPEGGHFRFNHPAEGSLPTRPKLNTTEPVVKTDKGMVRGKIMRSRSGNDYYAFTSIPFAKPPLGPLRFERPEPADPWTDVRDGPADLPDCWQIQYFNPFASNVSYGTEDCLYLSVFTPQVGKMSLPVMIYIHGGAYRSDSSDIGKAVRSKYLLDEDIVLVIIKYRLGAFGFMSLEDDILPGNMGLKDMALAIKWVSRNIEGFGGDPSRITLFGNNAGASSVQYLLTSPMTRNLVHGGISQSGTATSLWAMGVPGVGRYRASRLAEHLDCPVTPDKDLLDCLKTKTAKEIADAERNFVVRDFDPMVVYQPVIESVIDCVICESPFNTPIEKPWITGLNQDEGAFKTVWNIVNPELTQSFHERSSEILPEAIMYTNTTSYPTEISYAILSHYQGGNINDIWTDGYFFSGAMEALKKVTAAPAYLYLLSHRGKTSIVDVVGKMGGVDFGDLGVCHTDELLHIFNYEDDLSITQSQEDKRVSRSLIKLWTNFAKYGRPTKHDEWPQYDKINQQYLNIGTPNLNIDSYLWHSRAVFWENLPIRNILQELHM